MIGNFNDVKFNDVKNVVSKFVDSPLGKGIARVIIDDRAAWVLDKSITVLCEIYKNCPIENGKWLGERGNSKWIPEKNYIPQKVNPEGKTWGEILKEYAIDGINFKEGEPNFDRISKAIVEIKNFSDNRSDNFDKADIELAKQYGCSPMEVKKWRKENKYTWHECIDMKTMQMVASIVHNNISHRGGISEIKKGA